MTLNILSGWFMVITYLNKVTTNFLSVTALKIVRHGSLYCIFFSFWPDFQALWLTLIWMFMSSILMLNHQDIKDFQNHDFTYFFFFPMNFFNFLFMRKILYNFILNVKVLKRMNFLDLRWTLNKHIIFLYKCIDCIFCFD